MTSCRIDEKFVSSKHFFYFKYQVYPDNKELSFLYYDLRI